MGMSKVVKQTNDVFISEADQYVFGQGTHYEIYKKLGAHMCTHDGKDGVFFAVWAPNAQDVYVIGEFNGWNETANKWNASVRVASIRLLLRMYQKVRCTNI